MDKTSLGDRMKLFEGVSKNSLMCKTPVIIRIDGKAFHTYTRNPLFKLEQPYSYVLKNCFERTVTHMIKTVQGCKLAYLQSDEVSFLLTDWEKFTTNSWFNYNVQKLCSITASMFTYYFNESVKIMLEMQKDSNPDIVHSQLLPALFDARAFNLPHHEVTNYFIWRQQDAVRNSINMLGQHYFSHKELMRKNTSEVQDMLMKAHNVNWNDVPVAFKRGSAIYTDYDAVNSYSYIWDGMDWRENNSSQVFALKELKVDHNIPVFTEDRNFIERHLR